MFFKRVAYGVIMILAAECAWPAQPHSDRPLPPLRRWLSDKADQVSEGVNSLTQPAAPTAIDDRFSCHSDNECLMTRQGSCTLAAFAKEFSQVVDPHNPGSGHCKCLTGPVMFGCVPRGSAWDVKQ